MRVTRKGHRRIGIVIGATLWSVAVAAGIRELAMYETTAGASARAPVSWPSESQLPRGGGFSIVMFVHPECPCTRASLTELEALANRGASIVIVFDGDRGSMWDRAGRIPGAQRVLDDGTEAKRFGAKTSGHVVVFDRTGAQRFAGGITGSRGHAGKNVGRLAVERLLAGTAGPSDHAVFGCALAAS